MNLNVVSFNIWCMDAPEGNAIALRAPRLQAVIAPCQPDLIGFQEATPTWMEFLTGLYGETFEIYNVHRGLGSTESTPIAWNRERFLCQDKGNLWFSDTPEEESQGWDSLYHCPRIFTWAKLQEKATGEEFCFINTHFGFGDECQRKSAGMLIDFAKQMGCPCVITGDFNMEIDSVGYREMTRYFADVNAITVNDLGPTFHGFDEKQHGEHIDYCFVTNTAQPQAFRVIRDRVEEQYPSDHYGLFAALSL